MVGAAPTLLAFALLATPADPGNGKTATLSAAHKDATGEVGSWSTISQVAIGREGTQPRILDWRADREVV